jgi:hypothetical protein
MNDSSITVCAYVYKLTFLKTGCYYYGYRSGNIKRNRTPEEDLLIHYFTSSEIVQKLLKDSRSDDVRSEILFQSANIDATYWQEQYYIKNSWGDELLLNQNFQDPCTNQKSFRTTKTSYVKANQTRQRNGTKQNSDSVISKQLETKTKNNTLNPKANISTITTSKCKRTKNNTPHTRKPHTSETIEKQKNTKKQNGTTFNGIKAMHTSASRIKANASNSKSYLVTFPDGKLVTITGLSKFCKEHNLNTGLMSSVATGRHHQHKGFRCKRLS